MLETGIATHPCFQNCALFCERCDQSSFDPDYRSEPLDHFEPMLREVFSRKAYDPKVIREGHVSDLAFSENQTPLAMTRSRRHRSVFRRPQASLKVRLAIETSLLT